VFRITLRELFLLVTAAALAVASLRGASDGWLMAILSTAMLGLFCATVVAVADRGPRQTFAIAFVVISVGYGILVISLPRTSVAGSPDSDAAEFDVFACRLPTTRLLRYVFWRSRADVWIDTGTGKVIPGFDPNKPIIPVKGTDPMIGVDKQGKAIFPAKSYAESVEVPPRSNFMLLGHIWWATLFGYIGGHCARFVTIGRTGKRRPVDFGRAAS